MAWLDNVEKINRPFYPADYHDHHAPLNVEAYVYAEVNIAPEYALMEAYWAAEQAKEDPKLRGIIAHAPLEYGEQVRAYLHSLAEITPLIRGVRRLLQGENDPAYCLRPRFIEGVQMLSEFNLSFDICVKHYQLANAVKLVRLCPNVSFILDHIGKPDIAHHLLDPWRDEITELASMQNVVCKVSGMVTEAKAENWTADDLSPYVEHVLNSFGEDRVMFGGDWSVVLLASSYTRWVNTLDQLTQHLSDNAKRKLWSENGRRVYRL
jgi:L-fuconolactonase